MKKKWFLLFAAISMLSLISFDSADNKFIKFAGPQTALHTDYFQLKDNEVLNINVYNEQLCLDFSDIDNNKTSVLIRSMETDVLYSDLQKIGLERVSNVGNNTIVRILGGCNYSNKYINDKITSIIDYKVASDPQSYGSCFCEYKPITFSEHAWSKVSYDNTKEVSLYSDKFKSLFRKIFMSEAAFSWVTNDVISKYQKVSRQYPDDWKKSFGDQLQELEIFLANFNKNVATYKAIAKDESRFMPSEIGENQAFLYRRIVNDGLSINIAASFVTKMKNIIKSSVGNGPYSHFKDYDINNGNFIIRKKIAYNSNLDYLFIKSKGSINEIQLPLNEVEYVKCLQENGKDFLFISNGYRNQPPTNKPYKQLLVDQSGNVQVNTY
jgi:hypothetical protein